MKRIKYYYAVGEYVYLWRRNLSGVLELSANLPNNWTVASGYEPYEEFCNENDAITKREAKRFFPLATII